MIINHTVNSIKVECFNCHYSVRIMRSRVIYWPDHLWAGKISATFKCPKCKKKTGKWAHELPHEWMEDCPQPDWESYYLPRLIDSCYLKNIEPEVFKNAMNKFNIYRTKKRKIISNILIRIANWID